MTSEQPATGVAASENVTGGNVRTTDAADDDTDIPAGLLVSVGERGGYAVPRQLDGHTRR
jgi:hypothetical protein